jgi:hypothetical protein
MVFLIGFSKCSASGVAHWDGFDSVIENPALTQES